LPYSEVHRARSRKTGALVALKKIIMHSEKDGVCIRLLCLFREAHKIHD
jgi:serine/threonine-protein kinase BUR1